MSWLNLIKTYRYFLLIILFDVVITAFHPGTGLTIFKYTAGNFTEMLAIIPPIFLLLGLLDVWVPRETIIRYLGEGSGLNGIVLSIVLGAAAAGPLYGAFPVAAVMAKKGTKYSNIIIFLCSWSTLKIPMFLFEMSALGVKFALTRWLVNVPGILAIAYIIDQLIGPEDKAEFYRRQMANL
ncbi:permease [Moorella naiadis]|uniref:permease n=1 Tax=Moorella naiadis (nom. illeg.) TaxID=3093670 RepID=UPI003D9CA3FE